LITGGAGFAAANCAVIAQEKWDVYTTVHKKPISPQVPGLSVVLDITDSEKVISAVSDIKPKAIIHAAAISDTSLCAQEPDLAMKVNADAVKNMAIAASKAGARLVYISTDLVYDGGRAFYSETDEAVPTCCYGKSKLAGEVMAAGFCEDLCIARSATVYGRNINDKKNFAEVLIEKLSASEQVRLFSDEYRSFIDVRSLCRILLEMAADKSLNGIYNAGGNQRLSRCEFGLELAEAFGFDKSLIEPAKIDQSMFRDHRPEDCSMNISKLTNAIRIDLPDIAQVLRSF
jgi:dTDP-4-dehydrorhamnose reductase